VDSRIRYLPAVVASVLALALSAVASADPPMLTSVTGNCDPTVGSSTFSTTPLSGVHDDLDYRVKTDGGPADWQGVTSWTGASTFWGWGESLPGGSAATGTIECASAPAPLNYEIDWYTPPSTPASFNGVLTPNQYSDIGFQGPEAANYHLTATSTGGLDFVDDLGSTPFANGVGLDVFGSSGLNVFTVRNEGSPSTFTVNVAEEPPSLTDDNQGLFFASGPTTRHYSLDAPAHVTATLLGNDGVTPIRTLLNANEDGAFAVPWDMRDAGGTVVPDGSYAIQVVATNSAGSDSIYDSVPVDTQPPQITISAPSYPGTLLVRLRDFPSGVTSATGTLDGAPLTLTRPQWLARQTVGLGTHTVSVSATDRAGHFTSATKTFTVVTRPPFSPPPSCSDGAKTVVRHSPALVGRLRRLAHLGHRDVFKGFAIRAVLCTYLRGQPPNDKVILLRQRHGDLTPLVVALGDGHGGWVTTYTSLKPRIVSISLVNYDVMERRRVGRTGHHTKLVHLRWDGHALVAVR
jgi:hypothetical protein